MYSQIRAVSFSFDLQKSKPQSTNSHKASVATGPNQGKKFADVYKIGKEVSLDMNERMNGLSCW
jgi:hypothetical protein